MKLRVENTIRWRTLKDDEGNEIKDEFGVQKRESNARVVKWSDGRYKCIFVIITIEFVINYTNINVAECYKSCILYINYNSEFTSCFQFKLNIYAFNSFISLLGYGNSLCQSFFALFYYIVKKNCQCSFWLFNRKRNFFTLSFLFLNTYQ